MESSDSAPAAQIHNAHVPSVLSRRERERIRLKQVDHRRQEYNRCNPAPVTEQRNREYFQWLQELPYPSRDDEDLDDSMAAFVKERRAKKEKERHDHWPGALQHPATAAQLSSSEPRQAWAEVAAAASMIMQAQTEAAGIAAAAAMATASANATLAEAVVVASASIAMIALRRRRTPWQSLLPPPPAPLRRTHTLWHSLHSDQFLRTRACGAAALR